MSNPIESGWLAHNTTGLTGEQITVLEVQAQDTAGRFIACADDPDERQQLAALYREQLAQIAILKRVAVQ